MKCLNCGFENQESVVFCQGCGAQLESEQISVSEAVIDSAPAANYAADWVLSLFKDKLFLVLCILYSIMTAMNLSIIGVLITVFMWLCFANAKKNIVNVDHMRCLSGTLFARYILNYAVAGLLVILSGLLSVLFGLIGYTSAPYEEETGIAIGILIAIVLAFYLSMAAIVAVINYLCYRKFHILAKTLYKGVAVGDLSGVTFAKNVIRWLWANAIITLVMVAFYLIMCATMIVIAGFVAIVYVFSAVMMFVTSGVAVATYIVSAKLINKYLVAAN